MTTIYRVDYYSESIKPFEIVGETDKFWKIAVRGWKPGDPDRILRSEKGPNEFRTWAEAHHHLYTRLLREQHRAEERFNNLCGTLSKLLAMKDPTQ